jgi:hypothetical protein
VTDLPFAPYMNWGRNVLPNRSDYRMPRLGSATLSSSPCAPVVEGNRSGFLEGFIRRAVLITTTACFPLVQSVVSAVDFEVTGRLAYQFYESESVPGIKLNSQFKASVADCKVLIHSTVSSEDRIVYHEFGSDGVTSRSLDRYTIPNISVTHRIENGKLVEVKAEAPPVNDSTVQLDLWPFPGQSGLMQPVWLAFGSRCWLTNSQDGLLPPVVFPRIDLRPYAVKMKTLWTLASELPNLPSKVVGFRDNKDYSLVGDQLVAKKLPAGSSRLETNYIYEVLNWTNVADLLIPQRFKLTLFDIYSPVVPSRHLWVRAVYEGAVDMVKTNLTVSDFEPQMTTGLSYVVENRLLRERIPVGGLAYLTTNGVLLTGDQLRETAMYKSALKKLGYSASAGPKRILLYVLLGLFLILPFVVFLMKSERKTRS